MITRENITQADPSFTDHNLVVEFASNVVTVKAGSFKEAGVSYTLADDETHEYTPGVPAWGYLIEVLATHEVHLATLAGGQPPDWHGMGMKCLTVIFLVHDEGGETVLEKWKTVPLPAPPAPSPPPEP